MHVITVITTEIIALMGIYIYTYVIHSYIQAYTYELLLTDFRLQTNNMITQKKDKQKRSFYLESLLILSLF